MRVSSTLASVHFARALNFLQTSSLIFPGHHTSFFLHHHPKSICFETHFAQTPHLHHHICAFAMFLLLLYFYYISTMPSSVKVTNPNLKNHFINQIALLFALLTPSNVTHRIRQYTHLPSNWSFIISTSFAISFQMSHRQSQPSQDLSNSNFSGLEPSSRSVSSPFKETLYPSIDLLYFTSEVTFLIVFRPHTYVLKDPRPAPVFESFRFFDLAGNFLCMTMFQTFKQRHEFVIFYEKIVTI